MSFYVYIYLDPTKPGNFVYGDFHFEFEPFYVGKAGSKKRKKAHLFESQRRKDTNSHKINRIRSIQEQGLQPIILEVKSFDLEQECFDFETNLISLIGRRDLNRGPLTNKIDSQHGLSKESQLEKARKLSGENNWITGVGHSEKTKELMSQRKKEFLSKNPHPRLGKSSSVKGKSYEEILGVEKARELKESRREVAIKNGLGTKGRFSESFTQEERARKAKAMKERTSKPLYFNGKYYPSVADCIRELGITRYFLSKKIKEEAKNGLENS